MRVTLVLLTALVWAPAQAGALELNNAGSGLAVPGNLQVGDNTPVSQMQTLDLHTFGLGDSVTVKVSRDRLHFQRN